MRAALRTGARVRAPRDAQHTDRGRIDQLAEQRPAALVRLDCGCRLWLPLARLVADERPAPAACEAADCTMPRFEGPYCAAHAACRPAAPAAPRAVVRPEGEGQQHAPPSPVRAQREIAAIDDARTQAAEPRATAHAARGRGVLQPPAVSDTRAGATGAPPASAAGPTPPAAPDAEVDRGASADAGRPVRPARTATGAPSPASVAGRRSRRRSGPRTRWTRERIIAAMQAWAAAQGRSPVEVDWAHRCPDGTYPSRSTVARCFGGWLPALDAAGLPRRYAVVWTREVIIDRIREWVATYGEPPSSSDWTPGLARYVGRLHAAQRFAAAEGHWPHARMVMKTFGTWNAGIREAGYEPHRAGPRHGPGAVIRVVVFEPATVAA